MVKTAVILAAGKGSKLFPYCDTWQKAALPVANRSLIRWQIDALRACGIQKFIVVINHFGSQVRHALDGVDNITFVEQKSLSGTANALQCAFSHLTENEYMLVYGDTLFHEGDIRTALDMHQENHTPLALVQSLGSQSPQEWLCVNLSEHKIKEIYGHPREASHRLCGIYILNQDIHPYLDQNPGLMTSVEVGNMPPVESELAESISQYIQSGKTVQAVECQSLFFDIDKPWHYLDASDAWLSLVCSNIYESQIAESATISPNAEIEGFIHVGENSIIGSGAKIKGNCIIGSNTKIIDGPIIGEHCVIGDNCEVKEYSKLEEHSAIGNKCVVGHAAEFGGVLMDGAYSYHYGEYWGIIGRSSDLGAATVCGTLRFDDQNTIHRVNKRREVTPSNSANASYLGDFVRTGVNAILMPGVKVGAYSVIGAGVILNEDLPKGTSIFVKQEYIRSTWGPERYGW